MALLANEWARRGQAVSLITLEDSDDVYELAPAVERVRLGVSRASRGKWDAVRNNWRRLTVLRKAILERQPGAVISFMDVTNILTLLALSGTGVPVIVSERIDPRHYAIAGGWQWLRKCVYPRARAVVVQTEAVAVWARDFLPEEKVVVIPNPVDLPPGVAEMTPPHWLPANYIAAMGRLDRQKGFDLLLDAFQKIAPQHPDVHVVVVGEGPERAALERLAEELHLADRVTMPGRVDAPWPVLAGCRGFVMSSRFEGYPNALLEAMALGAPVVSFDCPSGPGEMITDGVDGVLVEPENTARLAAAMDRVLQDEALRLRLSKAAQEKTKRFGVRQIVDLWERLI